MSDRFLRIREVIKLVGISKPTIYRMIRSGDFPMSVKLTAKSVAWRSRDITEWMESRQQSSNMGGR